MPASPPFFGGSTFSLLRCLRAFLEVVHFHSDLCRRGRENVSVLVVMAFEHFCAPPLVRCPRAPCFGTVRFSLWPLKTWEGKRLSSSSIVLAHFPSHFPPRVKTQNFPTPMPDWCLLSEQSAHQLNGFPLTSEWEKIQLHVQIQSDICAKFF